MPKESAQEIGRCLRTRRSPSGQIASGPRYCEPSVALRARVELSHRRRLLAHSSARGLALLPLSELAGLKCSVSAAPPISSVAVPSSNRKYRCDRAEPIASFEQFNHGDN